jgi:hypothetical protein
MIRLCLLISVAFVAAAVFWLTRAPSIDLSDVGPPPLTDPEDLKNRNILLQHAASLREFDNDHTRPDDFTRKFYRLNAWWWSYRARASLLAYRMFGDIEHVKAVLKGAIHFARIESEHGWHTVDAAGSSFREITTAGLLATPIIQLLLLSRSDQRVNKLVSPHEKALRQAAINGLAGFDEWYRRHGDAGYYVTPRNPNRVEATNHMALFAVGLARAFELTGEEDYRTRVAEMTRFWLLSVTRRPNGTLSWPYGAKPGRMKGKGELFWKASVTIELPLAAQRIGIELDPDILIAAARTLERNVLSLDGRFIQSIDGTGWRMKKVGERLQSTAVMWHLLDCFYRVPNLNAILYAADKNFYAHTSRSLYGAAYGLYLARVGCGDDALDDN